MDNLKQGLFLTIDNIYTYEYKINKSKFIAIAIPLVDIKDINNFLKDIKKKYKGANHYCYAYKLGIKNQLIKAYDDGEPSKTAGQQILNQINSFNLTNILIIVVRYFGGTLLGISRLIKAYKISSKKVLENAKILVKELMLKIKLEFIFEEYNSILYAVKKFNAQIIRYNLQKLYLIIQLPQKNTKYFFCFLNSKNIKIKIED